MGSKAAKQKDIVHRRIVYRKYKICRFPQGFFPRFSGFLQSFNMTY